MEKFNLKKINTIKFMYVNHISNILQLLGRYKKKRKRCVQGVKKGIRIIIKSYDKKLVIQVHQLLNFLLLFLKNKKTSTRDKLNKLLKLPLNLLHTNFKKFTILRSPHIDNDSREQYELKIHKCSFDLKYSNLEYVVPYFLSLNLPSGVYITLKPFKN
jgi:small subunit ribosomal protein S10